MRFLFVFKSILSSPWEKADFLGAVYAYIHKNQRTRNSNRGEK